MSTSIYQSHNIAGRGGVPIDNKPSCPWPWKPIEGNGLWVEEGQTVMVETPSGIRQPMTGPAFISCTIGSRYQVMK